MAIDSDAVRSEIKSNLGDDGQLSCASAHKVAEVLGADPTQVGDEANSIDIRITRCQLGLFGFAPKKGMPGYKVVNKLDSPDETILAAVKEAAAEGSASCLELWRIAKEHNISRLEIGNYAETLDTKVTPCQLGCF